MKTWSVAPLPPSTILPLHFHLVLQQFKPRTINPGGLWDENVKTLKLGCSFQTKHGRCTQTSTHKTTNTVNDEERSRGTHLIEITEAWKWFQSGQLGWFNWQVLFCAVSWYFSLHYMKKSIYFVKDCALGNCDESRFKGKCSSITVESRWCCLQKS